MRHSIFTLALFGALALGLGHVAFSAAADAEIVVVVNKTSSVGTLNKAQLGAIYRARTTEFPSGLPAVAVNLPTENPLRQAFDKVVLGMSPDEAQRFWIDAKIRSGAVPPRKLPTSMAVARFVGSEIKGLGYVAPADAKGLKVVARIRGGAVSAP
jgi:hypothetical protein